MTFSFDPREGLVVVRAELSGPAGTGLIRLALDTGATSTLINVGMLVALGYDPGLVAERMQVTTGSGVEYVPRVTLRHIRALGHVRKRMAVLAHTLPSSASVDGLLGLDFVRGRALDIDFRTGRIDLR